MMVSELSIARWRAKIVEIKATIEALRNQARPPVDPLSNRGRRHISQNRPPN